ncbi:MAG TPA: hypothetical protein DCK78_20990 [Paenibacillus lactis]|uniref:hypothetical protein n=1 Tax=Paenibacillus TaxID=44249 RepID=UPI000EE5BEA0|nr:hypothetical protein [Paenibacillus lactis]
MLDAFITTPRRLQGGAASGRSRSKQTGKTVNASSRLRPHEPPIDSSWLKIRTERGGEQAWTRNKWIGNKHELESRMDSKPAGTGRAGEGSRGSWVAAASTLHIEVMNGKAGNKKET